MNNKKMHTDDEDEYGTKKVKEWYCKLWRNSLYITKQEREKLTKLGMNPNRCILIDRDKNGTCIFAHVRITGPIIIKGQQ